MPLCKQFADRTGYRGQPYEVRATRQDGRIMRIGWTNDMYGGGLARMVLQHPGYRSDPSVWKVLGACYRCQRAICADMAHGKLADHQNIIWCEPDCNGIAIVPGAEPILGRPLKLSEIAEPLGEHFCKNCTGHWAWHQNGMCPTGETRWEPNLLRRQ